jgi:hypothetical protein
MGSEAATRVRVQLTSTGLGPHPFSPLDLPGAFDVELPRVDPDLLRSLHAALTVTLRQGHYPLPLTRALILPVEVPRECTATGKITASRRTVDGADETCIDSLDLVFAQPLILRDILHVLAQLSDLAEDDQVADWLAQVRQLVQPAPSSRRARLLRGVKRLVRANPQAQELLRAGEAQLAHVTLSKVHASPVFRQGTWQLDLRFSGHFHVFGRIPVPFHGVHLPRVILPWPYASLRRLMSDQPLASATLHAERVPVVELATIASEALAELDCDLELSADMPEVEVRATLPSRATLLAEVPTVGTVRMQGKVHSQVTADRAEVSVEDLRVELAHGQLLMRGGVVLQALRRDGASDPSVAGICALAAADGVWPADQLLVQVHAELQDGSRVDQLEVHATTSHPMLRGTARLGLGLRDLSLAGRLAAELAPETRSGRTTHVDLQLGGSYTLLPDSVLDDGTTRVTLDHLHGRLDGQVQTEGPGAHLLTVQGEAALALHAATTVSALPELDLEDGQALTQLVGRATFHARLGTRELEDGLTALDFDGSRVRLVLDEGTVTLQDRAATLPPGSVLEIELPEGRLSTSGLGHSRWGVRWDLQGQSPVLRGRGHTVEPLVPDLRQGDLTVHLSQGGGLSITGEEHGLYDARYFNALLNPDQELDRWRALLSDDEALDHIVDTARVFSDDLADLATRARTLARRAERAAEAEGIHKPADAIPAPVIARMLSRMLVESTALADRLLPLVLRVVAGEGLDLAATRQIVDEIFPDHDLAFELDRVLRWLDRVLSPTEPIPPRRVQHLLSLAEEPAYVERFAALPSASELYRTVRDQAPLPPSFSHRVARVAPYLGLHQLTWLLDQGREDWRPQDLTRLRRVAALKERVALLAESYGGPAFAPQAAAVSLFLGSTVHHAPEGELQPIEGEPPGLLADPDALLGPAEVAGLLRVGLAAVVKTPAVQLNQRLLLDLVLSQSGEFLRQVLYELSDGIPRVLTGMLMSLLDSEQGALRDPLDLVEVLSARLGVELPRRTDFMAGGRWASQPYYAALDTKAQWILAESEPYPALLAWLQTDRRGVPAPLPDEAVHADLIAQAQAAITHADALGHACTFTSAEPGRRQRAREAYEAAFAACRAVIAAEPRAFRWPWLKAFWHRNYEALVVLSVVRNVTDDVDRVRPWLQIRTGRAVPRSEQRLVQAVIDALYLEEDDRTALKADPLVRLLLDPPEGHYDFTVISCMGVITDGEKGRELEDAYKRLTAQRGVRVLRANTASARSLEYNATRVEAAIRQATTPWGYIGYSQGCANGLRAETLLMGGTPDQQALLDGLVCRHFLFNAFNGTAHGTAGDLKLLRAMVDAETFLSYYQAVFSGPAIEAALKVLRMALDAPLFVRTLGGVDSLSYDGAAHALREVQVRDDVPSTTVRGVVREEIRPEALDLLSNLLTRQIESDQHDTQVMVDEAVGHPVHVRNPATDLMRSCDMGSRAQITHHWSPLLKATEMVTTARDRARGIYDFPKDRHVFPWVEVNARFGVIGPKGA